MGGIWRMHDRRNYEELYLRPHQSGNPDANQYTPVFHGLPGWQLYHGDGHGVAVTYPTDTWIHVKIVFSGTRGEVYIDSEEPVLAIASLSVFRLNITITHCKPRHIAFDLGDKNAKLLIDY